MTTNYAAPLTALSDFTSQYHDLFNDKRLRTGFDAAIAGILGSGSTKIRQIARAAPQTCWVPHSERRFRRLIRRGNKRGQVKASEINQKFLTLGAKRLKNQHEVRIILDGSDLRKPYSTSLEHLTTVRALNGDLIPGYCTLNAVGISSTGVQALLYQKTFSPLESGFKSERDEVRMAIQEITKALRNAGVGRITWILDRGFDDEKVIHWIIDGKDCFVIRAQHNRNVSTEGAGKIVKMFKVLNEQNLLGSLEMKRPKLENGKQRMRLSTGRTRAVQVFLNDLTPVNVVGLEFLNDKAGEGGWVLLTNLPVNTASEVQQVIALYALRWAIEEVFAWTKSFLDWEAVQVLDFEAIRMVVAYSFIAAGFVFELEQVLEPRVIGLLAHLGGWVPRANTKSGRRVLTLGLQRFISGLVLQSVLGRMQLEDVVLHSSIHSGE